MIKSRIKRAGASEHNGISLLREVAVGPPPWRGLTARYKYQALIPSAYTRLGLSPRRRPAGTRKLPTKMACKLALTLSALLVLASCSPLPTDEGDEDTVVILPAEIDDSENSIDDDGRIDLSYLGSGVFGQPSNDSGAALEQWSESSLMNPEEMGEYAEGDILIPTARGRNGINAESARWPDGIVPYVIEGHFNQQQRDTIMKAIADYHRLTCIRFVPYNGQRDYITIRSQSTGCWSSVGKLGGRQEVNLQVPGCVSKKGTVLHELLHALGFMHEQSRPERDDYVDIRYNNIKPGSELNFKKADQKETADFGVTYDYNSVMHYSEYAFSRNGQKTIEPKVGGVKLGQREGLSRGDVRKLNNMYNCKKDLPLIDKKWTRELKKMRERRQIRLAAHQRYFAYARASENRKRGPVLLNKVIRILYNVNLEICWRECHRNN
ncbi:Zinc metalloproteinase nas-14 [Eumeta japonica]|uniref:Metalloendopeptidase n=1 Tax=Eumeta variegata TaxID=151549 RepID=A0A4C1WTN3_EUMVA|nr:Zinc metalloproteinase nas-14 [Eumeta japonica]